MVIYIDLPYLKSKKKHTHPKQNQKKNHTTPELTIWANYQ